MMHVVNSEKVPISSNAPFSQSVAAGDCVYISGQIGLDENGKMAEGFEAQAEQVLKNMSYVLEANGIGFDKVVKATCFLTDISNFEAFNAIYSKYFTGKPARSCYSVKDLPLGALVEVEAIAYLK